MRTGQLSPGAPGYTATRLTMRTLKNWFSFVNGATPMSADVSPLTNTASPPCNSVPSSPAQARGTSGEIDHRWTRTRRNCTGLTQGCGRVALRAACTRRPLLGRVTSKLSWWRCRRVDGHRLAAADADVSNEAFNSRWRCCCKRGCAGCSGFTRRRWRHAHCKRNSANNAAVVAQVYLRPPSPTQP